MRIGSTNSRRPRVDLGRTNRKDFFKMKKFFTLIILSLFTLNLTADAGWSPFPEGHKHFWQVEVSSKEANELITTMGLESHYSEFLADMATEYAERVAPKVPAEVQAHIAATYHKKLQKRIGWKHVRKDVHYAIRQLDRGQYLAFTKGVDYKNRKQQIAAAQHFWQRVITGKVIPQL